jgi:3-isopropylmalate dehydrogenase
VTQQPYPIAVIPGDGIGPEVVEAELAVLEATGIPFDFSTYSAGDEHLARTGTALPEETLRGALDARAVIFGAAGNTAADVILRLRAELGTFVNLRPTRAFKGVECLFPETNLVIVRENTECLYAGIENTIAPGVITATRVITDAASYRIARQAFEYARQNGRNKVTAVHKANVLRKTDGLFLECCRRAAAEFPGTTYEEALVDSLAMRLVLNPLEFDVIVTTNLFGDILSDLAAGLIGGLGTCPSANLGDKHALFEPVHGTAPDIAGKGIANPCAAIMCGAMLLRHLAEKEAADRVDQALESCLAGGLTTPDLGGKLSTMEMAQAVVDRAK